MRTDEIRERLAKATPGEWSLGPCPGLNQEGIVCHQIASHGWHSSRSESVWVPVQEKYGDAQHGANLELFAHAPADLRYLLDRLDKAEKVCEAVNYHFAKGGPYSEDRLRVAFSAWAKENQ